VVRASGSALSSGETKIGATIGGANIRTISGGIAIDLTAKNPACAASGGGNWFTYRHSYSLRCLRLRCLPQRRGLICWQLPSTKQNAGADLVLWAEVQSSPRIHVTTMRNGRSYAISKTEADEQNENRILRRGERTYSSTKKLDRAKRKLPNHGVTIFPMTCQFLYTRKELFPGFHVL
jgi:hypothetical protein